MENRTYKITLADGSTIENLSLNGNNYISKNELTEAIFKDNLERVTIACSDGNTEELERLALVQIQKHGEEYWFVLRKLSKQEIKDARTQANIEYLAMMTNVDLGEV